MEKFMPTGVIDESAKRYPAGYCALRITLSIACVAFERTVARMVKGLPEIVSVTASSEIARGAVEVTLGSGGRLNESFADFFSYFGLVKATEFKDGWQNFYSRKSWAYYQDQLVTTHPIATDASDTDIAFSNFDGISYAKGASVLKQLMNFLGEGAFKKALHNYFKKYEWKNTELKD